MFLSNAIPSGWLKLAGQTIYRAQYPSLFTKMGWGDSITLPNMNGRFAEGSNSPGQYKSAGLPNITGDFGSDALFVGGLAGGEPSGVFSRTQTGGSHLAVSVWAPAQAGSQRVNINASRSSAVYGRSSTVQPNSVTFVYAIKVI